MDLLHKNQILLDFLQKCGDQPKPALVQAIQRAVPLDIFEELLWRCSTDVNAAGPDGITPLIAAVTAAANDGFYF